MIYSYWYICYHKSIKANTKQQMWCIICPLTCVRCREGKIGDGIVEFGGKITGDLTVDVLVVTSTGKVDGNVRARSVTVEGHLNGTIAAVDVILASTSVIKGEIVAEKIRIDFGANVEGRLKATTKATV